MMMDLPLGPIKSVFSQTEEEELLEYLIDTVLEEIHTLEIPI